MSQIDEITNNYWQNSLIVRDIYENKFVEYNGSQIVVIAQQMIDRLKNNKVFDLTITNAIINHFEKAKKTENVDVFDDALDTLFDFADEYKILIT